MTTTENLQAVRDVVNLSQLVGSVGHVPIGTQVN